MRDLFSLFYLYFKRSMRPRNLGIMAALLLIFLFSMHQGIKEHKKITADVPEFQKIETAKFNELTSYDDYSNKGFNVLVVPPAGGIFFPYPVLLAELSGKVDSIVTLAIQSNCKGGMIFRGNSKLPIRFSNVVTVLLTLALLFFAYTQVRPREFFDTLSSIFPRGIVFLTLLFYNIVFLLIFLAVIIGCCLALCSLEGISLTRTDLSGLVYSLVPMLEMLIAFIITGILLGCLKSKELGLALLIAIWISFVFILPWAEESRIEAKSYEISSPYQVENNKLKTVNRFEVQTNEKYGKYNKDDMKTEKMIVEHYYDDIFPLLEKLDNLIKAEISRLTDQYHHLSMWFPTTFYHAVCNELSGRGYLAYLDLFSYLQKQYRAFVRFWIDRVYYHDQNIMVCFIQGDDNLFPTNSKIPPIFMKGILINLGWLILLGMISFFLSFKRHLHHMKKAEIKAIETDLKKEPLELDKGDCNVLFTEKNLLPRFMYNVFTGEIKKLQGKRFCEEVLLDGVNICAMKNKKPVLYISIPHSFPGDMPAMDFLQFIFYLYRIKAREIKTILEDEKIKPLFHKRIKQLKSHERFEMLYLVLHLNKKKSYVYLIDDTEEILPDSCLMRLNDLLEQLKEEGVVIYITQPQVVGMESLNPGECFVDGQVWFDKIKKIKRVSEVRNLMKPQERSK
jgi:hypothetical protein